MTTPAGVRLLDHAGLMTLRLTSAERGAVFNARAGPARSVPLLDYIRPVLVLVGAARLSGLSRVWAGSARLGARQFW